MNKKIKRITDQDVVVKTNVTSRHDNDDFVLSPPVLIPDEVSEITLEQVKNVNTTTKEQDNGAIGNIANLIKIREYVFLGRENMALTKDNARHLNNILSVIDNKILEHLKSKEFLDSINYEKTHKEVHASVIKSSNIKSSLNY